MKVAIIYESLTGNTKLLAETIQEYFQDSVVYCGKVEENIEADVYLIGSWTDKGTCSQKIAQFLNSLDNKTIGYFATAGFGGSQEYYDNLWKRIESHISHTNIVLGHFFCQGKMPMNVRERYVAMMREHPDDHKLAVSIRNFDEALSHPDNQDLHNLKIWLQSLNIESES